MEHVPGVALPLLLLMLLRLMHVLLLLLAAVPGQRCKLGELYPARVGPTATAGPVGVRECVRGSGLLRSTVSTEAKVVTRTKRANAAASPTAGGGEALCGWGDASQTEADAASGAVSRRCAAGVLT